jgi:hypothetical protein
LADDCRLWNDPLFLPITAGLPLLTTCSFKYLPCLHTTYHTSCLSEMIYFLETPCGLVFQANKGKISMAIFKILVLFSLESNYCHIVCVRIRWYRQHLEEPVLSTLEQVMRNEKWKRYLW